MTTDDGVAQRPVAEPSSTIGKPAFVGRTPELAALTSALAHEPSLVLIEGEAGIGKTRLLHEYLASSAASAHHALVATCPPFRRPQTLGPVCDAIRLAAGGVRNLHLSDLAGALRPLFPEWAADLPPAPDPAEDATAARHRLFRALAELLAGLRPTLLVVEDVHWADEATLEFLLFMSSSRGRQLSIVASCRPEDVGEGSLLPRLTSRLTAGGRGYRITLGPLDVPATAGLVSSMLSGESISEEFAAFVHRHTEGVPLAVEESLHLMVARQELVRRDDGWVRRSLTAIQVPPTIRDAVLERTSRLSPHAQAVLWAAAVLAEPADEATIRAVAHLTDESARAGLSTALSCGILTEASPGLHGFRHALARQAVYESIPPPERRMLHQRASRALEKNGAQVSPIRLARHFQHAGQTAAWHRYGEQAADLALATGDEAAAAVLLLDLITKAGLPPKDTGRLARKLILGARPGQASLRDVVTALRSMLAAGGLTPEEDADIRFHLGHALVDMHEWALGRAELERAVPHLGHDPAAQAWAMTLLAWPRGTTCPVDEHIAWLRAAAALPAPTEPLERLRLSVARASVLLTLGREEGWAEAARLPPDAPTARERALIALSHLNVGDEALRWGRYAEAASRLDMALEMARRHDYHRRHYDAAAARLHLDWFTGTWEGLGRRAADLAGDEDARPMNRLEASLVAGLLEAASGSHRQAEEHLRQVLAEARQRTEMQYVIESAAALATLWLAGKRGRDALRVTQDPIATIASKGTWVWATDLVPARVSALAAAGLLDEAGRLVSAFESGLRGLNAPAPQAGLLLSQAILAGASGRQADAAALFACAADAWDALPRPYEALLAREREARRLLAADREPQALDVLSEVFRALSQLGARRDAVRVMRVLGQHGRDVKRPWWGGRQSYGDQLSPREVEVAHLLVAGRTNRAIAQALSLSPRTVDRHLYRAMRKLNVNSRSALAARVVAAGIVPAFGAQWQGRDHSPD